MAKIQKDNRQNKKSKTNQFIFDSYCRKGERNQAKGKEELQKESKPFVT